MTPLGKPPAHDKPANLIQPGLFDRIRGPGRSRRGCPDTSRLAALVNAQGRSTQAARVYRHILEKTPAGGCTIEEVCIALNLRPQSAGARGTDLKQAGMIRDTGNRRRTSSGAYAAVMVAVHPSPDAPGNPAPVPGSGVTR